MAAVLRVAVNARLLCVPTLRGWNRYTVNLLVELLKLDVELILLTQRPIHESHLEQLRFGDVKVCASEESTYGVWEQVWTPYICAQMKVDLLHCPFNFGLPIVSKCPRILTLHDAIDDAYTQSDRSFRTKWRMSTVLNKFYHNAARVAAEEFITVSHHAKADIQRIYRVPQERIHVIANAADDRFFRSPTPTESAKVREKYSLPDRYFFYVGGWERRKNLPFLLSAYAASCVQHVDLVLAGGDSGQIAELSKRAEKLGVASRVRLLGWVDDADLPQIYNMAEAFVYPSEYEGFGLQAIEAMACGCPVLAARASSLPETVGTGGQTFALNETRELASLLQEISSNSNCRAKWAAAARKRAREFSWTHTAVKTLELYNRVVRRNEALFGFI